VIASLPPKLRPAVSPYTGIIRSVEECLAAASEPPIFRAFCQLGAGEAVLGSRLDHVFGVGGTGRTRAAAATAAVGEALERYSASYVPVRRLVSATARELGEDAVSPGRFAFFSDRQHRASSFPFRRFDERSEVFWIEGREIRTAKPAYLPAELVFLGAVRAEGVAPIAYATSSGLACAEELESAVERALLELLERDAFMVVWANRLSLPLLDWAGCASIEADEAMFARAGLRYAAVDLSAFHRVPTVLGVVRAPVCFAGAVGVGAAAATTIEEAWWKAVAEAFATRAAGAKLALLAGEAVKGAAIRSFEGHIRHYAAHANAGATTFLDAGQHRSPASAILPLEGAGIHARLAALCRRVEEAGSNAYAVDVTSPDVADLGLTVARVIAPELCSLDVRHDARFLGGRRLYEAATRAGFRRAHLREQDVNPDPHPFP
jgi:ribosomal protein S12 methylthiotransferase accessory factor